MQIVSIRVRKLNGLSYFELYVRGVYLGLYASRDDARAAARRFDWSSKAA